MACDGTVGPVGCDALILPPSQPVRSTVPSDGSFALRSDGFEELEARQLNVPTGANVEDRAHLVPPLRSSCRPVPSRVLKSRGLNHLHSCASAIWINSDGNVQFTGSAVAQSLPGVFGCVRCVEFSCLLQPWHPTPESTWVHVQCQLEVLCGRRRSRSRAS